MIALILLSLVSMVVCYRVANQRKANTHYWLLIALLIGPFAIPFVFFSKPQVDEED